MYTSRGVLLLLGTGHVHGGFPKGSLPGLALPTPDEAPKPDPMGHPASLGSLVLVRLAKRAFLEDDLRDVLYSTTR